MFEEGRNTLLEWAAAWSPIAGESETGDLHLVRESSETVLLCVIDGLGHGKEAALAARRARDAAQAAGTLELQALVKHVHEAAKGTRGVTMSVARVDGAAQSMSWVGVGNVEATLVRASPRAPRESMAARGGVVGYKLPSLAPRSIRIGVGDTLVLATDGIRTGHASDPQLSRTPAEAARHILQAFCKPDDDALILVARFWGREAG